VNEGRAARPSDPHAYDPSVRVVVTGGAGFIGSHVAGALISRGDEVHVVDNLSSGRRENLPEGASFVEGDIRDGKALRALFDRVRPDACAHLAAQADVRVSVERPDYDADVNVLGTIQVLQSACRHDARLVFTSTGGAIYGECERPAREDDRCRPLSPYGTSKLAGEEYLLTYTRLHGGHRVALRLGNVFGPRQDPHGEAGVVAIFLGLLATGGTPRIFGDGRQTRDYVYVEDVVDALLQALAHDGGVFNVGTGRETSVLELFEACVRVSGRKVEPEFAPARAGELGRSVLDPELAGRSLGFRAAVDLDDGLRATWDWVRASG
jgi:UDP-glucose 4-epimerase